MKWEYNYDKTRVPKEGEERFKYIFPIMPTKVGDYVYWLERIHVVQKFVKRQTYTYDEVINEAIPVWYNYWENIRLVNDKDLGFNYSN